MKIPGMSVTRPKILPESLLFILGCQRSGSTWLANILDASPDTLLFMEPFSRFYNILPEFPDSSTFLSASSPQLNHLLTVAMPVRLMRYKSLLFQRSLSDPRWFRMERWLARRGRRLFGNRVPVRIQNFELLNLNRMENSYPLYPKHTEPSMWVIKELRLAGKIPVLLEAFPSACFVVIMRHPFATVHSVLNWFQKGSLGELKNDLETYLERLEAQPVSELYSHLIDHCRGAGIVEKVALYWRVSYETILRELEGHLFSQLLVYEQLASEPKKTVGQMFDRLGLAWSPSVDDYISYSSKAEPENPSPIDTRRESRTYYQSWIRTIPKEVQRSVLALTGDSFLMHYFAPYYQT